MVRWEEEKSNKNHSDASPEEDMFLAADDPFLDIEEMDPEAEQIRGSRIFLRLGAVILILLFGLTMIARWAPLWRWSSYPLLQESQALLDDPQIRDLRQAVVRIKATGPPGERPAGGESLGTGFNISAEGVVITNYHILKEAMSVSVSFTQAGRYQAIGWEWFPDIDLALLFLEGEDLPYVELGLQEHARRGDEVLIIGNPFDLVGIAVTGFISNFRLLSSFGGLIMEIVAPIYPGNSGSPVFNKDGKVVGVIFAATEDERFDEKRGLAVPVTALSERLSIYQN